MRNVKTALSVLVCLLIDYIVAWDSSFLACVAAIICLQDSVEKSVTSGLNRLYGTALGALMGIGFLYLNLAVPSLDLTVLLVPVGTILFIMLCNILNKNDSIVIGLMVFLAIVMQQSALPPYVYALTRLVNTAIGVVVAIVINRFIRNPDYPAPAEPLDEKEVPGQISFTNAPEEPRETL